MKKGHATSLEFHILIIVIADSTFFDNLDENVDKEISQKTQN